MIPRRAPLPGVEQRVQTLSSFSDLDRDTDRATAVVLVPSDEGQLSKIFDYALRARRKVTMRGGGHAFDHQSLGGDLVVSMERFNAVRVDASKSTVTVGGGATWGEIVSKLDRLGLVMPGGVTTAHATAGGTLASDCLSRFSPLFGKEGARVEKFRLLTINGPARTWDRPTAGGGLSTLPERVFLGAISGFGYVGAFLETTYRVTRAPVSPTRVRTVVDKHADFSRLADSLIPSSSQVDRREDDPHAIWAALYPRGDLKDRSALVMDSSFTNDTRRRPFPLFDRSNPFVILAQYGARVHLIYREVARRMVGVWKTTETFYDDLADFMFFMDANTEARKLAAWINPLSEIQQTFLLPSGDQPQRRLGAWLERAEERLTEHRVQPLMADAGYIPKDDLPFYLSPNAHSDGFAISYAFGSYDRRELERAQAALSEMSEILWDDFRGRVSLVKNVYASPRVLTEMYRGGVDRFFELKRDLDPHCILCNDFLERVFPEHCRAAGCRT